MSSPPRRLRVGYADITVRLSEDLEDQHGLYSPAKKLITLAKTADSSRGAEGVNTLLHELLHAGYELAQLRNLELSSEQARADEERVVTVLANHLTELFARNPKLLKWIALELHGAEED